MFDLGYDCFNDNTLCFAAPSAQAGTQPARLHEKAPSGRPAWARTQQQIERDEEEDVDALLSFTDGLDYDKYLDDLAVSEQLASVHARIQALEAVLLESSCILIIPF